MLVQRLSGPWQFRKADEEEWLPAQVPGGVHTDLMACGRIPDPFVADNEKHVQWVAESDWEYRCTFDLLTAPVLGGADLDLLTAPVLGGADLDLLTAPVLGGADLLAEEKVFLVCDGLDTLAEVTVNGHLVGQAENMFRQYRWEIKSLLREGENELRIAFASPVRYVTAKMDERPLPGVSQAIPGGSYLRKAPCQFGWDWGPMLPPIGIWEEVRLEGHSVARLSDVHLQQHHGAGMVDAGVTLSAALAVERWQACALEAVMRVTGPDGQAIEGTSALDRDIGVIAVQIDHPRLWWPNGCGEQPLYQVEVTLWSGDHRSDGQVLDRRRYQVGLRTIELERKMDEWGESFTFVVNGVPVFAKGSNWIPADSFPTRLTDAHMEHLIRSAAGSHQNMLRVWGGGLYEEDRFYDLCDRYGILVWQDCVFSCSIYPFTDQTFLENVRIEIEENVRRLRHRASLALWCGNNEMEWGWTSWGWDRPEHKDLKAAYDRFFHRLLPAWCAELDPDRPYWPSSPSSGIPFDDPNAQERGDAHYWDVWHGRRPFTAYRGQHPRLMSEFGFQSLPPLETIRTYAAEKDWNLTSYVMEHHQRGNHGNGLILAQMTDTLRMPKDFPSLVYLSMVLQAEGIRYGVEHWRRNMHRVSGTIYWQLNDCWPVASWASIDYFGRWKALHYAARRFFAPLLLSVEDAWTAMGLHVTSDLSEPWAGTLRWSLETLDGQVLEAGEEEVMAAPLANTHVRTLDFFDRPFARELVSALRSAGIAERRQPRYAYRQVAPTPARAWETCRNVVLVCELCRGEERVALQVATFVPSKHLELADPGLAVDVRQDGGQLCFDVTARSLARFVELSLEGDQPAVGYVVFSDNYFDVPAGRTATVTCPLPEGWTLDQARAALRVRSLYDSFA